MDCFVWSDSVALFSREWPSRLTKENQRLPSCSSFQHFCSELKDDLIRIERLNKIYPRFFRVVQFEHYLFAGTWYVFRLRPYLFYRRCEQQRFYFSSTIGMICFKIQDLSIILYSYCDCFQFSIRKNEIESDFISSTIKQIKEYFLATPNTHLTKV